MNAYSPLEESEASRALKDYRSVKELSDHPVDPTKGLRTHLPMTMRMLIPRRNLFRALHPWITRAALVAMP